MDAFVVNDHDNNDADGQADGKGGEYIVARLIAVVVDDKRVHYEQVPERGRIGQGGRSRIDRTEYHHGGDDDDDNFDEDDDFDDFDDFDDSENPRLER